MGYGLWFMRRARFAALNLVWGYVYLHICTCVFAYMYMCICMYVYVYLQICICVFAYMYICIYEGDMRVCLFRREVLVVPFDLVCRVNEEMRVEG